MVSSKKKYIKYILHLDDGEKKKIFLYHNDQLIDEFLFGSQFYDETFDVFWWINKKDVIIETINIHKY